MIVQCPDCSSRFRLAEEKIKPSGTKIRCSNCKKIFTVMPPEQEPSVSDREEQNRKPEKEPSKQNEQTFFGDDADLGSETPEPGGVAFHELDLGADMDDAGESKEGAFDDGFSDEFDFKAFDDEEAPESDAFFGESSGMSEDDFSFGDHVSFEDDADFPSDENVEKPDIDAPSESFGFSSPESMEMPSPEEQESFDMDTAEGGTGLFDEDISKQNDPGPLPPPVKTRHVRKSGRKGVAFLVILLLVGAAAGGYFVWQKGLLDKDRIFTLLHIKTPSESSVGQIGTSGLQGFFLQNGKVGRLFVIQGEAVNEFQEPRSAISVKGMLFDDKGALLLQQTVFCGNPLRVADLRTMPFERIVERMDNQFGDSLSNLNVPPGKSIPFTIVFRNLPDSLSEFSVEVVDSKPVSH
jgi:predicted Zn finger-like uncharacterized protein